MYVYVSKNKLMKKSNKTPVKQLSNDEVRSFVLSSVIIPCDIDSMLKEMGSMIIPKYKEGVTSIDTVIEKSLEILRGLELDSHVGLMETVDEKYRALVKELSSKIIKEYSCQTTIEKALAEQIANAHVRIIDNSRRLNNEFNCRNITLNRNNYISNLSKQLDRAHRQFDSAVFALKQLKQPQIEVNVKATNAFVSNNQLINVTKKDEIIEA
jgi:hypothetical protein